MYVGVLHNDVKEGNIFLKNFQILSLIKFRDKYRVMT